MGKITEDALKLLKEKQYFKDNESTWEDICRRVSKAISSVEKNNKDKEIMENEIYSAMSNLEFIFSTPCLLNADINNPGQLSSCFILDTKDNIEDITRTDAEFTKIFQKNGGAGTDLSVLRPARSKVETSNGYAGGVITFMGKYDKTADDMTKFNPSRKGAIKINLQAWHPDIFEFIHCKDNLTTLNRMNISVSFSDDFMNAVENDSDWNLEFPDYSWNKEIYNNEWNGNLESWKQKGYPVLIYKTIKAKQLLKEFSEASWKTGEPGANYQTRMNIDNMNPHLSMEIYTNPCFAGDMKLLTEDGYKTFEELDGKNINIINNKGNVTNGRVWCNGVKDIIKLNLANKSIIKCTPNHVFMLIDSTECEAKDLKGKKIMPNLNYTKIFDNEFIKLGFIQGDGSVSRINSEKHSGIEVYIGEKDKDIFKLFENEDYTRLNESKKHSYYIKNIKNKLINLGFDGSPLPERVLPITYTHWSKLQKASFIQGCYSANGSVIKNNRISYKTTSKIFALQLQKALINDFNIESYITTNKSKDVEFLNGTYKCRESYDLNITRYNDIVKFHDEIGFYHKYKRDCLNELLISRSPKVLSIKPIGKQKVYDFNEPENHWGIVEGFVVHNCSEFANIPYSSCNLGSINLLNCIENGTFDWAKLRKLTALAIKSIDNMIEINILPLHKIDKITKAIRPIGLGIMGLADAMYALNIKYNSQNGREFAKDIINVMEIEATETSILLAQKKGTYPAWKGSKWEEKGIEIRNSNLLSIAPTGTISFIAGVSGGCEPNFALSYSRRTYDGNLYHIVNPIFKMKLESLDIYSDELITKIEKNHGSCKGIKEIPEHIQNIFVTAHDLTPQEHVDMVAILQKHVDLSISKTVNFSNNATIDDIYNIYEYAWKQGLKGLSVYRDGSRENQTLSTTKEDNKETKNEIVVFDSIHPMDKDDLGETFGTSIKKRVACGSLHIQLFRDVNGNLAELFISTSKGGICQSNINAISRLISLCLRGGIKVESICEQICNIKCPACTILRSQGSKIEMSCADAIGQYILDKYNQGEITIKEHKSKKISKMKNNDKTKCPNCGEKMRMESGCVVCTCGFSRCG